MDRIKALYLALSKNEQKALKSYLSTFHTKGENKSLELLLLIEKKPHVTPDAAADYLYGDPRSKAFIMMKSRLLERMVEFLPLTVNPGYPPDPDPTTFVSLLIEFRKQMLAASMLFVRRQYGLAREFFLDALNMARQACSGDLEVDAIFRLIALPDLSLEQYQEYARMLERSMRHHKNEVDVFLAHETYLRRFGMTLSSEEEKLAYLDAQLPPMREAITADYSPKAGYYLQMLLYYYALLRNDYLAARDALLEARTLLETHQGLYQRSRMANVHFLLGTVSLQLGDYSDAHNSLLSAQELLRPGTQNHYIVSLNLTLAWLQQPDLVRCREMLEQLREYRGHDTLPLEYHGLYDYLWICIYYHEKNYSRAITELQQLTELNFDKEGWVASLRIFEIMLLIEKNAVDLVPAKLENLRKHLSRYKPSGRIQTIFRMLSGMHRSFFSFGDFKQEAELLRELEEEWIWKVPGDELIRFDAWYRAKKAQARG